MSAWIWSDAPEPVLVLHGFTGALEVGGEVALGELDVLLVNNDGSHGTGVPCGGWMIIMTGDGRSIDPTHAMLDKDVNN